VRNVYQHRPAVGEEHTAKARRFVFSAWHGTVYLLCGDERKAERERGYYRRTAEEAVLDTVKDWYDKKGLGRNLDLAAAIERWYVPEDRQCRACKAQGRVHPSTMDECIRVGGKELYVANVPVMKCGACHDYSIDCVDLMEAEKVAGARALRYYGPTPENLVFARKALGYVERYTPIGSPVSGDQIYAWEQGGEGNLDKLPEYASYLVERLETTW